MRDAELELIEAYQRLIAETDFRRYCDDHDMATETWERIDMLVAELGGE